MNTKPLEVRSVNSILANACITGEINTVKLCIANGARMVDLGLRYACREGHFTIIKYLIEECKATDFNGALSNCCTDNLDIVKYLVEVHKAHDINGGSWIAAAHGNLNVFKYLIEKGVTDFNSSLIAASCDDRVNIVRYMMENLRDRISRDVISSVLKGAYRNDKMHVAKCIIDNSENFTMIGVQSHHIQQLLNLGLDAYVFFKFNGLYVTRYVSSFIKTRNDRNAAIEKIMLENTCICKDVVLVVCSYTEY